ncbi:MAG: hypothetical protein DMG41_02150 [Acidobacteria bacterium]|nr:MAG: hypothetical protein DMG41_02150 [Acidobacteriota bacterium]
MSKGGSFTEVAERAAASAAFEGICARQSRKAVRVRSDSRTAEIRTLEGNLMGMQDEDNTAVPKFVIRDTMFNSWETAYMYMWNPPQKLNCHKSGFPTNRELGRLPQS